MTTTRTTGRQMVRDFVEHEHRELMVGIDHIHVVAAGLAALPADRRASSIATVVHWVDHSLKPHMAWEESWLCPQIRDRAIIPWVMGMLRFDHRQITHQADRLTTDQLDLGHGASSETLVQAFSDLLGLEMLLRANLAREEHFLVPLLEGEIGAGTPE